VAPANRTRGTPSPDRTTVAEYLAIWLERRDPFTTPQGLRKFGYRTWAAAESRVRNHIAPLIGAIPLVELDREDVVWMLGALAERGVRPPTLQKCRDHLVSALRQAIKERSWGIEHNVAAAVDAPADPDAPTADDWYTLTASQADAFLAHLAGSEYEALYELCLHLGLRQSEAFGLRWADLDLDAGSLAIRQSLAPIRAADRAKGVASGQLRLGLGIRADDLGRLVPIEPKTRHSRATLPLTEAGIRLLRDHHQRETQKMVGAGSAWRGGDVGKMQGYVWTTSIGMPITPSKFVLRHFKPLCARAGIPTGHLPDGRRGFRFHDMRHSTASIMAARGERPEVIQRVMRHAKVSFTLDRYVKVYREDIREAVQRNDRSVRSA
jgi:integrase